MSFTPPTKWAFWLAAALAIVGLISTFVAIPVVSGLAIYVIFLGWLLLAISNAFKGI